MSAAARWARSVTGGGVSSVAAASDVDAGSARTDGYVLTYDAASGRFRGEPPAVGGGAGDLVVDVTAAPYNADPTGTNDCFDAIQNAVNAVAAAGGGVVFIPRGRYVLSKAGGNSIRVPFSNAGMVTIRGAGRGATVLQLSAQVTTAFGLLSPADGASTFRLVTLEDFTVDAMNLNAAGAGTVCQFFGQKFNIDQVTVRRTEALNQGTPSVSGRRGVYIGVTRTDLYGQTDGTNTVTNVLIEQNRARGGASGFLCYAFCTQPNTQSQNATATKTRADVVFDNIVIRDNDYDGGVVPIAFYTSAGIQTVGDGLGKRVVVANNRIINCGDVGIECDSTLDLLIQGNHLENCRNEGIYMAPNHGGLPAPWEQVMRVRDNSIIRPGSMITMYGIVSNARDGAQHGHLVVEGNRVVMQGTFTASPGEALRVEGPHRSTTFRNNTVVYDGFAYTATANGWSLFARALFYGVQGQECRLIVDGLNVEYRGQLDAAGFTGGALQSDVVQFAGGIAKTHGSIERVVVRNDVSLLNGAKHNLRWVTLNGNANVTDDFSSDRLAADYTFVAGASTDVAVAGGVLTSAANHGVEKRLRWVQYGGSTNLNQVQRILDAAPFVGFTTGAALAGLKVGHALRASEDDTTRLELYYTDDGVNGYICFDKIVAGVRTSLLGAIANGGVGTVTALTTPAAYQSDRGYRVARVAASTAAGIRAKLQGNTLTADLFGSAAAPAITTNGTTTTALTLAGGDVALFGIDGPLGWYDLVLVPVDAAATVDNLRIDRLSVVSLTYSRCRYVQRQPLTDAKGINLAAASTLLRLDGAQRVRDMDFQSLRTATTAAELTFTDSAHATSFVAAGCTWITTPAPAGISVVSTTVV